MTELYLVNYLPKTGEKKWDCFRTASTYAGALDMSEALRNSGHKTRIQTVLICPNGEAHTDLDKAMETVNA